MYDDKLARIRKLLAQAEDPAATAAEAEAFNAKAAELMARHGVDAALLAASDPGSRGGRRPHRRAAGAVRL